MTARQYAVARSPWLLAGPFLGLASSCADDLAELEVARARDRAADHGARGQDEWVAARALLRPLAAAEDAPLEDLLRAANAELAYYDEDPIERALPLLERAERLAPGHPVILWARYQIAWMQLDLPAALELARRLRVELPDDFLVKFALAKTLVEVQGAQRDGEAEKLYRELVALPFEYTGAWHLSILYRLATLLMRTGRSEEAAPLFAELAKYQAQKIEIPDDEFHSQGTLGVVRPHTPTLFEIPRPEAYVPAFASGRRLSEGARGAELVHLGWGEELDDRGPRDREVFSARPRGSLATWGAAGVALELGAGAPLSLWTHSPLDIVPFDRLNHGIDREVVKHGDRELDLLALVQEGGSSALYLLENVAGRWTPHEDALARLPTAEGAGVLLTVDHDHDGDVDLLVSTNDGVRLLRNDGLDGSGGFTDATGDSGLPEGRFRVLSEDLDRDDDVDFLLLAEDGSARLASNLRAGRFEDRSADLPAGLRARWIVPADFDGDSWVDLAAFDGGLTLFQRNELGGWRAPRRFELSPAATGEPRAVDWDLDGTLDLLWPCDGALAAGLLAPGFESGPVSFLLGKEAQPRPAGPAWIDVRDLDDDLDQDLLRLDSAGMHVELAQGPVRGTLLALQGYKSNARGIGTVLQVRSGLRYQRLYYRGTPELVGFGGAPFETVALTWPNGVWQGAFDVPSGVSRVIAERPGQIGSCPFLYTWNGTTYEFISDVLGITPLGLPMAPGMLVPPDHDEYVLVKGEQLVPKDGFLEMHFTEELREVTYLDRIRLDVVDHPLGTEAFPNERFSFPPFPEAHTHTVRDPLAPLTAVDQDGKDWKQELARDDRSFAIPFEALNGPYRGLATPYTLELAFDPERVRTAAKLRLFLNGWFYWTDASVNMAVARHPDLEFVPPILSVPDGNGGWKELGPIGFPAGKLKTMAVDVSELLNRADPRIRLFSTLRLYWDSIRLATDADDAPLVTTALEPASASLWQRGFSRSFPLLGAHDCEWFEWDALEPEPRWNQHPGLYTRLGDTLPLVGAIDDRFVVMGAGDALTVRFDAKQLPPLPDGWRRDYLVFLDGWAKDRDPNTLEALYVEPLPFHGMSGFPYGPDERYPDDEAHRAYRREWNTRPARQWIESLVPPRPSLARTAALRTSAR
jgi:tetratricopeptide (TPR) repeat protein